MLEITIPSSEFYDESTNEFINIQGQTIELEHSLVAISKWESKWKKPFLTREQKTLEEFRDYIRCMTLTENVNPVLYYFISNTNLEKIIDYINDPRTATWFNEDNNAPKRSRETITSELIYYWMVAAQIPFECQYWHINRLMTLIRIYNVKNTPPKQKSKREMAASRAALNKARRAKTGSHG